MKNKVTIPLLSLLLSLHFSPNVCSQDTVVRVVPAPITSVNVGAQFNIDIVIENGQNVAGYQVVFEFNSATFKYISHQHGAYLQEAVFQGGPRFVDQETQGLKKILFAATSAPNESTGDGVLATLTFEILQVEASDFILLEGSSGTVLSNKEGTLFSPQVVGAKLLQGTEPDLVIESASANYIKTPAEQLRTLGRAPVATVLSPGQQFELYATIRNKGSVESTATLLKFYGSADGETYTDGKLLDAVAINPLLVNGTVTKHVRVLAPKTPGTYDYGACISDSEAGEHCVAVGKITVRKIKPDLVIESINPPGPLVGSGQFEMHITVKNEGALTSAETTVKYYRSTNATISETDTLIATSQPISLTGKRSFSSTLQVTAPQTPGTYYYGACVESVPDEINTDNNCSDTLQVVVMGNALEIPEGLISDVAFTPNHTYFVLHPQFVSTNGDSFWLEKYWRQKCVITLHLGTLHLDDDSSDYYMLPLPPKAHKSELEQGADIAEDIGETIVMHITGKAAIGKLKSSNLMKVGKALLSFGDISKPEEDPKATIGYYPNEIFGTTTGGDLYPILFIIKNKRLSRVGFQVAQDYYDKNDWVPIDIDLEVDSQLATDNFLLNWLPNWIENPLVLVGSVVIGGVNVGFGTAESLIEGINNAIVDKIRKDPTTISYEGEWNLEETFRKENSGMAAPSAHLMSLADYPPFQQLPLETQVYLLEFLEETNFGKNMMPTARQIPQETNLLPNYPNPFNPETWIPYQLTDASTVRITIYDAQGRIVRTLEVGHQRAGMYHGRSRAAYWDGKNEIGEPVASGLYFYTLTAGDFTATRKMLILK